MNRFFNGIVNRFTLSSKIVDFPGHIGTMRAHHGCKSTKLYPPYIQFLKGRISCPGKLTAATVISSCKETTNISIPIGYGAH